MLNASQQKLLVCCGKNPQARGALICFPFSGAGPAYFKRWSKAFGADTEFYAVQLQGREGRFSESMTTSLEQLINDVVACIAQSIDKPYVFFGHSLGAYLAWSTALRIQQLIDARTDSLTLPAALVLTGRQAPDVASPEPLASLDDESLLKKLVNMGGIPAELLKERELLQYALPKIRYDLSLNETSVPNYLRADLHALRLPLYVYEGMQDRHTQNHDLTLWKAFTTNQFHLRHLKGDHFFISETNSDFVMCFKKDVSDAFSSQQVIAVT